MLIKGKDLTPEQKRIVASAFPYRWTTGNPHLSRVYKGRKCPHCGFPDNVPAAGNPACRAYHPSVPMSNDGEWIEAHAFHFVKDGSRLMVSKRYAEPVYLAGG